MGLFSISVRVNGVYIGSRDPEDFFNKFGNCDGSNIVGLVAEAYFVKRLWSMGYEVIFAISHNIEVRRISRGDLSFECVGDYGEVTEKMPAELKRIVDELREKGIDISFEDDGDVPVYFKGSLLFKKSIKKLIYEIISRHRDRYITRRVIFDKELEPFQAALGLELIYTIEHALETHIEELPGNVLEDVLNNVEKVLAEKGLKLEEEPWTGLEVSNEKELVEELRKLNQPTRFYQ